MLCQNCWTRNIQQILCMLFESARRAFERPCLPVHAGGFVGLFSVMEQYQVDVSLVRKCTKSIAFSSMLVERTGQYKSPLRTSASLPLDHFTNPLLSPKRDRIRAMVPQKTSATSRHVLLSSPFRNPKCFNSCRLAPLSATINSPSTSNTIEFHGLSSPPKELLNLTSVARNVPFVQNGTTIYTCFWEVRIAVNMFPKQHTRYSHALLPSPVQNQERVI